MMDLYIINLLKKIKWFIYKPAQIITFKNDTSRLQFIIEEQNETYFPEGPACYLCNFTYAKKLNSTRLKARNDTSYFNITFIKTIPPEADPYHPPVVSHGYFSVEFSFYWKKPGYDWWYINNPNYQGLNRSTFLFESIVINGHLFDKVIKYEQPVFYGMGKIKNFYYDKFGGLLKFTTQDGDEWVKE